MKNIGILTLSNSDNYGAVLQAYSLKKFLENAGFKVFFVPHAPVERTKLRYLLSPMAAVQKSVGLGFSIRTQVFAESVAADERLGFSKIFSKFRFDQLGLLESRISFEQLLERPPAADAIVVGSDVVWGYDAYFNDPTYLLDFCPPDVRRISYAASFGKTHLESYQAPIFKAKLPHFHAISVREQSGKELLQKLGVGAAEVVCDPTFLIDSHDELYQGVPSESEPYILAYLLPQDRALHEASMSIVESHSKRSGLPVKWIKTPESWPAPMHWDQITPTPERFLRLINDAALHLTNSFHGAVFSFKFETPFQCLPRDLGRSRKNNRILNLLDDIGAPELFCEIDFKTTVTASSLDIDWGSIFHDTKYGNHVEASRRFLLGALA